MQPPNLRPFRDVFHLGAVAAFRVQNQQGFVLDILASQPQTLLGGGLQLRGRLPLMFEGNGNLFPQRLLPPLTVIRVWH